MKILPDDVLKIAHLARIRLTGEEVASLGHDLEAILDYIAQLQGLALEGVEPTSHVLPLKNVYREDEVELSLGQEAALACAVERKDGFFKVPQIIEDQP